MKLKIITILKVSPVLMLLTFAAPSCKKSFLEINPKGKLIAQNVSDYELLLNSTDLLNTGEANAQVYMSDEVAMAQPFYASSEPRSQRLFKWEPLVYERERDAPETQSLLGQLYVYNKIIKEVADASGGTELQKRSIVAEARAGRAWVYFLLVNYFGKPYSSQTASGDPGFPIITAANVTETKFTRPTVQENYDFIVNDLVQAIPDLPGQTTHRYRMSRAAAEGLLAKAYMYMGRFEDALPLLNDAFEDVQDAAIPVEVIDYNAAFAPDGEFMPLDPFFGPSTPVIGDNKEVIYARQFSNFWIISSELVITPATAALFSTSDQRLNFYSAMPFPFGTPYPGGALRRTAPLTAPYGVGLPDMMLLRAECRARLNDLSGCVADLKNFRSKRMPEAEADLPSHVGGDQVSLLQFVFEERIREFASLGERWFDMRRLSVDPLLDFSSYKHFIIAEDGSTEEFEMPEQRLTLKMPPKILNENPGMQDNQ